MPESSKDASLPEREAALMTVEEVLADALARAWPDDLGGTAVARLRAYLADHGKALVDIGQPAEAAPLGGDRG